MEKTDPLRLENQLCFPLYACAREIVKAYRPYLDELGLTYTQYITMMVLWEEEKISVKELGQKLHLDSGTLTPLLKKLEGKGYLTRERSREDERVVMACITAEGRALKQEAAFVPAAMRSKVTSFDRNDAKVRYGLLYQLMEILGEANCEENKK